MMADSREAPPRARRANVKLIDITLRVMMILLLLLFGSIASSLIIFIWCSRGSKASC